MKTTQLATVLALAAGLASATTLTGTVSDAMCGAHHMMAGSARDCTLACVKDGSGYALVVSGHVFKLKGHEAELEKLAGARATVTGHRVGKTITVTSVQPAKAGK